MPSLRLRPWSVFVVWCLCGAGAPADATARAGEEAPSGQQLYESACAACHGADGRGAPVTILGFDTPVPDFTACSFSTPEADPDWMGVVHDGGPVRAFDRRMPAFGEALREIEIQRILDYIRTFCGDPRWPRGELNLPRALVTEKAFPENEAVLTTTVAAGGAARVANELLYERRIGARAQVEVTVPFVAHDAAGDWRGGLGDVAAAIKRVVRHSLDAGHIVSVAAEAIFPTGRETGGPGKGVTVFEPSLTFGQILPGDGFLQAQAGAEFPSAGGKEGFWRVAAGKTFVEGRFGRAWSPMIEVLASREIGVEAPVHWDLLPQVQVSLSKRQHILISGGVRLPVSARSGRSAQVLTYFLWDWFDGGLRDGWR